MKRRMESIDHQPKLITIRPKIQQTNYDGYIVSRVTQILLLYFLSLHDVIYKIFPFSGECDACCVYGGRRELQQPLRPGPETT